jgi:hypothetical protein
MGETPQQIPTAETPILCSLESQDLSARLDQWRRVLAGTTDATRPSGLAGNLVVRFGPEASVADLAALCADEVACCPFFKFDLGITATGVTLHVTVPDGAQPTLEQLTRLLPAELDRR